MKTLLFGAIAVCVLIISVCCLYYRRSFLSILGGIGTIAFVCMAGHSWHFMLVCSGKDTMLLGFNRYPAAPIMLSIIVVLAVAIVLVSAMTIVKKQLNG